MENKPASLLVVPLGKTGFPHLRVVDRWPSTPKRTRYSTLIAFLWRVDMKLNTKYLDNTKAKLDKYCVFSHHFKLMLFCLTSKSLFNVHAYSSTCSNLFTPNSHF